MIKKDIVLHQEIILPGEIPPHPRPKIGRNKQAYYPKKYIDFKNDSLWILKSQWKKKPIENAIEIDVLILSRKPKSKQRKKDKFSRVPKFKSRGDLDNIFKSIADVLEDAGVLRNDSQIYKINASSWYCCDFEDPKCIINITEVLFAHWAQKKSPLPNGACT